MTYGLAKPPFDNVNWLRAKDHLRWEPRVPQNGNAQFDPVPHCLHQVASQGFAGFSFIDGSMSSNRFGEAGKG